MAPVVPLTMLRHFPLVDVSVDGRPGRRFLFDTGAGITIVSEALLHELGYSPLGPLHTGERMTGERLSVPLYELQRLELGSREQRGVTVGGFDLGRFSMGDVRLDGILSLGGWDDVPIAIDYAARELVFEDRDVPTRPGRRREEVGVTVARHGPQVEVFVDLELPNGTRVRAEVDTGCDQLILHERYRGALEELPVPRAPDDARRPVSDDEPPPVLARLRGAVRAAGSTRVAQASPEVVLLEIIYDAVVGYDFLRAFRTTFDLRRGCLAFEPVATAALRP